MIDKTYEIRVENCRMKDRIEELYEDVEGRRKEVEELERVGRNTNELNKQLQQ
jgi:hypothetical protein